VKNILYSGIVASVRELEQQGDVDALPVCVVVTEEANCLVLWLGVQDGSERFLRHYRHVYRDAALEVACTLRERLRIAYKRANGGLATYEFQGQAEVLLERIELEREAAE
jgi:hypothetical protein